MIDLKRNNDFREAIEAMYFAYREFTCRPDEILEQRGLNRVHHRILYFVAKNPQISVGSLTELLQISKQALNMPLRQLIEMSFVHSLPNHEDRRSRCLSLTSKGRELEQQLTDSQVQLLTKVFSDKSDNELTKWISTMRAISNEFQ